MNLNNAAAQRGHSSAFGTARSNSSNQQPPEFSQQIFSYADKQIDICKYWNLTYFQNDVAN